MAANSFIKKNGFTLIEALIASAILIIAVASLLATVNKGVWLLNDIQENNRVSAIIQEEIENLRKRFFSQLPAYGSTNFYTDSMASLCNASGTVYEDAYGDVNIVRVVVTVTWDDRLQPAREKTKRAVTLITRNGINSI